MITMGFNTLAMLTWGLGIRMPWRRVQYIERPREIEFRDKPLGIAVEDKTGPTSFEDGSLDFEDASVKFEDE